VVHFSKLVLQSVDVVCPFPRLSEGSGGRRSRRCFPRWWWRLWGEHSQEETSGQRKSKLLPRNELSLTRGYWRLNQSGLHRGFKKNCIIRPFIEQLYIYIGRVCIIHTYGAAFICACGICLKSQISTTDVVENGVEENGVLLMQIWVLILIIKLLFSGFYFPFMLCILFLILSSVFYFPSFPCFYVASISIFPYCKTLLFYIYCIKGTIVDYYYCFYDNYCYCVCFLRVGVQAARRPMWMKTSHMSVTVSKMHSETWGSFWCHIFIKWMCNAELTMWVSVYSSDFTELFCYNILSLTLTHSN